MPENNYENRDMVAAHADKSFKELDRLSVDELDQSNRAELVFNEVQRLVGEFTKRHHEPEREMDDERKNEVYAKLFQTVEISFKQAGEPLTAKETKAVKMMISAILNKKEIAVRPDKTPKPSGIDKDEQPKRFTKLPPNIESKIDEAIAKLPDKITLKKITSSFDPQFMLAEDLAFKLAQSMLKALDLKNVTLKTSSLRRFSTEKVKSANILPGAENTILIDTKDKRRVLEEFIQENKNN